MKIQLIRNATMRLSIARKTILTDPVLSARHGIESFAGIEKNPTVELPIPAEDVFKDINLIIVTHVHQDHLDAKAKEMLPKDLPLFCQPCDADKIAEHRFTDITSIETDIIWEGIKLHRTPGSHAGNKKWNDILGNVSGFIFKAENEPVVYWAGDTVLNDAVKVTIKETQPDIIFTHSCWCCIR
jgi:L-ascorbate metabolism protein UlaG (beta-lactamase superfamily)